MGGRTGTLDGQFSTEGMQAGANNASTYSHCLVSAPLFPGPSRKGIVHYDNCTCLQICLCVMFLFDYCVLCEYSG